MFGDRLRDLVRESVNEMREDVELLERLLSAAKASYSSLEELAKEAEESVDIRRVSAIADVVLQDSQDSEVGNSGPASCPGAADMRLPEVIAEEEYSNIERALIDSGLTYKDRIIDKVRVFAQASGGLVRPGEVAPVFRKLLLSKGSTRNLPGYISKKMIESGEFERVGEEGTGLYRWLHFTRDNTEEVPDCGQRERYLFEELSEREAVVV